jgi:hypothetical protein
MRAKSSAETFPVLIASMRCQSPGWELSNRCIIPISAGTSSATIQIHQRLCGSDYIARQFNSVAVSYVLESP